MTQMKDSHFKINDYAPRWGVVASTAIAAGRIWGWLKEGDNELIEFGDEEDA